MPNWTDTGCDLIPNNNNKQMILLPTSSASFLPLFRFPFLPSPKNGIDRVHHITCPAHIVNHNLVYIFFRVNTGSPVVFTINPPQCQMEVRRGFGVAGTRTSGPVTVGDPLTLLIHMKSEKGNNNPSFLPRASVQWLDSNPWWKFHYVCSFLFFLSNPIMDPKFSPKILDNFPFTNSILREENLSEIREEKHIFSSMSSEWTWNGEKRCFVFPFIRLTCTLYPPPFLTQLFFPLF